MVKEKLKSTRISKGFTQEQVAEKLCINASGYNRRENGQVKIIKNEWKKIAEFLDVLVEDIFEEDEAKVIIHTESQTGDNIGNYHQYNNANEEMMAHMLDYIKMLKKENEELKAKISEK